jgi:hypothetical protein
LNPAPGLDLQKVAAENGADEGNRAAEDAAPDEVNDRYDERPCLCEFLFPAALTERAFMC